MLSEIVKFIVDIVDSLGYLGIFIMMTLESSFFPFPSEVALIPAGFLIHEGKMDLLPAFLAGLGGSLFGAYINYALGKYLGKPFLLKYGKYVFFKEHHYDKSEKYFESHGTITTFLGRLIPVFRQYISFPAGVFSMNLPKFLFYTGLGAGIWSGVLIAIGYIAGQNKELISEYSHFAIAGAIIFVILSGILYYFYQKTKKKVITKISSGLVIINERTGKILLQDRRKMKCNNDAWGIWGGHAEQGETPIQTVLREIKEEINLELKDEEIVFLKTEKHIVKARNEKLIRSYFLLVSDIENEKIMVLEGDGSEYFGFEEAVKNIDLQREKGDNLSNSVKIAYKYYLKNYEK